LRFLISDFRNCTQAPVNVPRSKPVQRKSTIRKSAWAGIRLFAMDVDGVLTDGRVHVHSDGTESKAFSILDGLGLVRLRKTGIALAWISGRISGATAVRAAELQIPHLVQGRVDKLAALQEIALQLGLTAAQVCYMGDDDIDAAAIAWAGIGVAPVGAMPPARSAADFVPARAAGHGAVREVCEQILAARGQNPAS
jgi:3-deoxy-D-manno-octulosonate 8-phosphate phosphatase (KDO 8-P phosphatase)